MQIVGAASRRFVRAAAIDAIRLGLLDVRMVEAGPHAFNALLA
jgi:hypothetical protein